MRNIFNYSCILILLVVVSCGKDNYDEPTATLTGRVLYNGTPVQVRGTGEAVQLFLFQDGWPLRKEIPVYVGQDGTFSAKLFNGEYKMVTRDNNGPWVNSRDTLTFTLEGRASVDLTVTPYFTLSGENISLSGTTMNASFTINRIVPDIKLQRVYLVLSKTQFVDEVNNVFRRDISDVEVGQVNLTANFSDNNDVQKATILYGRIGVKAEVTEQAIWSPVVKLR